MLGPHRAQFFWCVLFGFVAHFVIDFFALGSCRDPISYVYTHTLCVRMQTVVCDFFFFLHLKNNTTEELRGRKKIK